MNREYRKYTDVEIIDRNRDVCHKNALTNVYKDEKGNLWLEIYLKDIYRVNVTKVLKGTEYEKSNLV